MPETNPIPSAQASLVDHVREHGSHSAAHVQRMLTDFDSVSGADIADLAHFLCILHGRHPGVVDHAANKTADIAARKWLVRAMEAFSAERAFLTKLTVAAGPISGVGASDQSNATVLAQRKALDMLSQSDRDGCALGASFALVLDWHAVRPLLDKVAIKLGVEPREAILPDSDITLDLSRAVNQSAAIERAVNFGAEQILAQHRGLWQLLEARSKARQAA
ncbi:hypothetical protein SAMN02745824_2561 [Parasphingorhabdus marina DSM 22363]|uniref:Uncharacterized protein n=1 Tax=Parasphingorhabdus marina DSM 22363 TaxID=1123272 RepID=A0A1N6FVC5_9SPHN|nr:hypothetical protein [Parasphingorhabdus marina]SIN99203.1 hypothetical protein SAMN02745824_2561 [Parasphingorhabdus marina DSM 22363]